MLGPESTPDTTDTTPADVEERVRRLEERVRDLQDRYERRPRAVLGRSRPRALLERMVPSEVRAHLRASQREQLLALRAWLDVAIQRTEQAERPRRPESVRIE
jgi:hypothetical protein